MLLFLEEVAANDNFRVLSKRCKLILCHATQETPVMQPTRCTRCPRKKCGILVATKIKVTSIDDMFLYAECLFLPICIENI